MRASPGPTAPPPGFDALFDQTVLELEERLARLVIVGAGVASALVVASFFSASSIPPTVLAVTSGYILWYFCVCLLLRTGRFRPWMRYVSSLLDVSLGSIISLVDIQAGNPLFASLAAGPSVYAVAVAMATLRLQPRLCLFAGLTAASQLVAFHQLVLRPAIPAELLASGGWELDVALTRGLFLVIIGALGLVASRSIRALLWRLTESAVERERVRGLLGMHVSEQVMEHLLSGRMPEGGERRAVTICFTDIRDFTRLSESQPPEETVRLLNLYFSRMCEVVAAHGGVVNKFLGDGMLIVFGAPAPQPDDASRALAAARAMLAEAERLREGGDFPGLRIGVGLHRGEAVVGNVGGAQRQEYTVIGDTVNTASRVQDSTKALGRSLLLTREVRDALGEVALEPLGTHPVKGRLQPLELFSVRAPGAERAA
jgi:adenylate cyclase